MANKQGLPIRENREASETLPNLPPLDLGGYKDELNLAEFPIAALTDRVPDGQTTLVFEDRLEQTGGPPIIRRLTIMAPSKHGLPTAVDDEVMVGLIQLTKRRNNYTEARVPFSRYELIELLGWPQNGQSYQRIEEALHRWVGVVLMYENAWWDNSAKSWVDENFHILENVSLYDRERRRRAAKTGAKAVRPSPRQGDPLPLSSFRWNEVIFRSFQSGNLKQLDLEFYLKLRLPTTKRMFRFLDKRFYRRDRLDFDLKTLACEHIGMSRSYKPTELKRRLRPAIEELETLGFLEPLPEPERYVWQGRGSWRIVLTRGPRGREEAAGPPPSAEDEASRLAAMLVERGVSAKAAQELVAAFPAGEVRARVEAFDWLMARSDKRVSKNPAGYLAASIRGRYAAPEGFAPPDEADRLIELERQAAEDEHRRRDLERQEAERSAQKDAEIKAAWTALTDAERDEIAAKVKAENPGLRRWKAMMEPLCLAELERRLMGGAVPPPRPAQGTLFPEGKPGK